MKPKYYSHDGTGFDDPVKGMEYDENMKSFVGSKTDTHVFDIKFGAFVPRYNQPGSPYLFESKTQAYQCLGIGLPDESPKNLLEKILKAFGLPY